MRFLVVLRALAEVVVGHLRDAFAGGHVLLGHLAVFALLLVLFPLVFGWRTIFSRYPGKFGTMVYFLCLGLGYIITEVAQDQLYDAVTPRVGLKVGCASLILALLLTWLHPSFETMFTSNFAWTVLQGIVWFGVFTLILQFHPWHALTLGVLTMLIVPGVATLGVDSIMKPAPRVASMKSLEPKTPVRQSLSPRCEPRPCARRPLR